MRLAILLLAAAACGALAAFPFVAKQKGWRVGEWFSTTARVPFLVAAACALTILGSAFDAAMAGRQSWWALAGAVVAYAFGGPTLVAIFGQRGSPLFLVLAPALAAALVFLRA